MMLRESSNLKNEAVNLADVTAGVSSGTEVPHAAALGEFADAVVARDNPRIARARAAVLAALGPAALVDVAAVAAGFHGFTRVADAIGIPYETIAGGRNVSEVLDAVGMAGFHRVRTDRGEVV
jgi:hypothetical protein